MALRVGLTGGVACGKTTVGGMLARRGAQLVQADKIAHQLMQRGTPVYDRIVQAFGTGVLDHAGNISRPRLADAAFGPGRISELNAIVHPAVIAAEDEWMNEVLRKNQSTIAVVEAALILEAHAENRFDKLIVVTCSFEQKVQRFAARHKLSENAARDEVERRMKAQLSDEEKVRAADYVIDNSGPLQSTEQKVNEVWCELARLSTSPHDHF